MSPTSRCAVLVPVAGAIDAGCEDALRELERRGYAVWRVRGYAAVDAARNQIASDALAQGFDELMWIDADIIFDPDDVDKLRQHNLPLVCGVYPKKACRQFACAFLPDTRQVSFGVRGGLLEILYCGFGFVYTRRLLYETLQQQLGLAVCNRRFQAPLVPYFGPMVAGEGEHAWYLGEDYSFCERARRCGFRIMADTTIRLWHVGSYRYGWEDAGRDVERFNDYSFEVTGATPAAPHPPPPTPPPQGGRVASSPHSSTRGEGSRCSPLPLGRGDGGEGMSVVPRNALHESVRPLPDSFPRLRAYCFSYAANRDSLRQTLEDFRKSDWGEEPIVFMQPDCQRALKTSHRWALENQPL